MVTALHRNTLVLRFSFFDRRFGNSTSKNIGYIFPPKAAFHIRSVTTGTRSPPQFWRVPKVRRSKFVDLGTVPTRWNRDSSAGESIAPFGENSWIRVSRGVCLPILTWRRMHDSGYVY
mmetsp:Transcript_60848/g.73111  ORF Transcript_60848/g.73111 Transcript_60848/m.73111 type:complete len:118 (+) Transcript_60848:529-882(+)